MIVWYLLCCFEWRGEILRAWLESDTSFWLLNSLLWKFKWKFSFMVTCSKTKTLISNLRKSIQKSSLLFVKHLKHSIYQMQRLRSQTLWWKPASSESQRKHPADPPLQPTSQKNCSPSPCCLKYPSAQRPSFLFPGLFYIHSRPLVARSASWLVIDSI